MGKKHRKWNWRNSFSTKAAFNMYKKLKKNGLFNEYDRMADTYMPYDSTFKNHVLLAEVNANTDFIIQNPCDIGHWDDKKKYNMKKLWVVHNVDPIKVISNYKSIMKPLRNTYITDGFWLNDNDRIDMTSAGSIYVHL